MSLSMNYLSFFVLQIEGKDGNQNNLYKHYQTLDQDDYENSDIKNFLHKEFSKICNRKAPKNPAKENVSTKVGTFVVEPGNELNSNPNFNMFNQLRHTNDKESFKAMSDDLVRQYINTTSARGGAMIVVQASLDSISSDPFIFILKCDFEQRIARISDERQLVSEVDMAISASNMKSIMYPHMPEEGMIEEWEIKIHQSSPAKYFEDFLKYVTYEQSIPEIINQHVIDSAQNYIENKWNDTTSEIRQQEEHDLELWAASDKRDIQEKWEPQQVIEVAEKIIEIQPTIELKMKLGDTRISGLLADYGYRLHITTLGDHYALIIEGDGFTFEKGFSPVELLQPESFEVVTNRLIDQVASKVE
ncbi:hypothetical protein PaeCFBP13512_18380 [Paenibacillus sp. CFBP13512]|uniref:DUF3900 domain-containing protein n=1 Tax=Paenibacillus sp. CFBP13512 TaxID=2184007 RepID=UPI0010C02904|nr:DUF3900 domain-containing protein [Paenibacillus sp. CFBP13512]TKJ87190.1 hypothetical protein PaeCFBP13512_18380 [Paenibacillus sp. CFBP13512]